MANDASPGDQGPPETARTEFARSAGRTMGRLARSARKAAREKEPEARRLASKAKPVAEQAGRFIREHDDEIKRAASTSARIVATRSAPPVLRPVIVAVSDELTRRPAQPRQRQASPPADDTQSPQA
jgi:hypothetical protein